MPRCEMTGQDVMRRVQQSYLALLSLVPRREDGSSPISEIEIPIKRALWYTIAQDGRQSPWCGENTIENRSRGLYGV